MIYYSQVFSSHSLQNPFPKKCEEFSCISLPPLPSKALPSISLLTPKQSLRVCYLAHDKRNMIK